MTMQLIPYSQLLNFAIQAFEAMGMKPNSAQQAAENLVLADLRGIDSHGVARLSGYVRLWQAGRLNARPKYKLVSDWPAAATLDADGAVGLLSATRAMDYAIAKANVTGTGWVGVNNSNHFGIAATHALRAIPHDCIGWAFTNASPLVAPAGGVERLLGTNPICLVLPRRGAAPIVIDMATTAASNGKLEILQRKHQPSPIGWLQDVDGTSLTDPFSLKDGASLLPLGSDMERSSYKGYALGAMVDLLSGVLTGANFGPWVPPFVAFLAPKEDEPGKGIGHMLGAMKIEAFTDLNSYYSRLETWAVRFKQSRPIDKQSPVLLPGEKEHTAYLDRIMNGIPMMETVIEDLAALSSQLEIPSLN